jgi:hypothetical protein
VIRGVAALDPVALRARTFEALRGLLVAEAGHRPLIVLIEDLHWIDRTSEEFLAGFVDERASVPIMLLVTYRPGYSPPWPGKSFTSQLALRPLSPAASEKIVASILIGRDRTAAAAIAERGEGNPFFLEELALATRDQADEEGVAVPETVQQVLAARIDRLTADQKAALQVAAVLGREFSLDLAEEVWDGDVPLEARLQELKGLEFLRERHGGPERIFLFTHALTREVAYDGMLEARRRELHGRAGASLADSHASQRFEHGELLAYHYSRSAARRWRFPTWPPRGLGPRTGTPTRRQSGCTGKPCRSSVTCPLAATVIARSWESSKLLRRRSMPGMAMPLRSSSRSWSAPSPWPSRWAARTRWSPAWSRCGRRGSSRDAPATPTRQAAAR